MSPLLQQIEQSAASNPDAPAYIHAGGTLTHAQGFNFVCASARLLHARGIVAGDTVVLAMGRSPLYCVVLLALARLGAICLPIPPGLAPEPRASLARRFNARWVVSERSDAAIAGLELVQLESLTLAAGAQNLDVMDWQPQADTPFRIALSSGTTGEPQGVMHTHAGTLARIAHTALDCDSASRLLAPGLWLTVSTMFALGTLCAGGAIIFPRSPDFTDLAQALRHHGATHALFSPAAAQELVDSLPEGAPMFPSLRQLRIVGATPPAQLLDQLRARCSAHLYVPYGLTELGAISMATPELLATHPRSAGRVLPWAQVQVVDAHGAVLPAGASGELRVAVTGMPSGYYGDAGSSSARFRDGWFYPGDFGRLDADGLLYVEGRLDDVLNVGGRKVAPGAIEQALLAHAEVRDAAAFLLEEPGRASVLAAAVILRGTIQPDLAAHCSAHLPLSSTPSRFFVMQEFPRNASGKLMRQQLALQVRA